MEIPVNGWRAAAVVVALGLVGALGDLREPTVHRRTPKAADAVAAHAASAQSGIVAIESTAPPLGDDADGGSSPDVRTADDARVVPAIFAWDPDVRFVYFRHVSKWM